MKILFCNYEYPPLGGGGGVMNAHLARELARRHEVTVLTSQGAHLPSESVEQGVRVLRAPVFFRKDLATASLQSMLAYMVSGYIVGKNLLDRERFDVINTHFALPSGPMGDALARRAGIPNILTVHGGDLYDPSKFTSPHRHPVLRLWIRRLLRSADMVVGQSDNTLANMRRYYAPEIEGICIPLGICRPRPKKVNRAEIGFQDDDLLLISVGRLIARKDVQQLIRMMAAIEDERVHLLVVGEGPEESALRQNVIHHGLDQRVHFMGHVEEAEKYRLLNASDVYVSSSQHEGFCLSFLEAMTSGLPIVCYDHGGHTDYLKDGETGFVVALNDLEGFTRRCKQLILDEDLRKKLGRINRKKVENYYVDSCAARYENLFEWVLEARRGEEHAAGLVKPASTTGR